jgi:hypothetical protein
VADRFDLAQYDGEGVVEAGHEDASHHVDDANGAAIAGLRHIRSASGHAGWIVGRAEQPRLGSDVGNNLFLVPHVIA